MNSFNYLKQKVLSDKNITNEIATKFIIDGTPSIIININNKPVPVAIVNRHSTHSAYVYTKGTEEIIYPGLIIGAKKSNYLIVDEVNIIEDVNFRKYESLICNCLVNGNYAYLKTPEQSFIDTKIVENVILSKYQMVLVSPKTYIKDNIEKQYFIGDTLNINGRPFKIIECDLTHSLIGYYSLEPCTFVKENNEQVIEEDEDNESYLIPGYDYNFNTEEGYFESNTELKNLRINSNFISFTVPYGLELIKISVKENGQIIEKEYKVKL